MVFILFIANAFDDKNANALAGVQTMGRGPN